MIKKLFALSVLVFFVSVGCGRGKYNDFKEVMGQLLKMQEDFVSALEKSKKSEDVVAGIKAFSTGMEKLSPKFNEIVKKYPELGDESNLPSEIKPLHDRAKAIELKLSAVMQSVMMKYQKDPKVQKALMEMSKK